MKKLRLDPILSCLLIWLITLTYYTSINNNKINFNYKNKKELNMNKYEILLKGIPNLIIYGKDQNFEVFIKNVTTKTHINEYKTSYFVEIKPKAIEKTLKKEFTEVDKCLDFAGEFVMHHSYDIINKENETEIRKGWVKDAE